MVSRNLNLTTIDQRILGQVEEELEAEDQATGAPLCQRRDLRHLDQTKIFKNHVSDLS